LPRNRTLTVDLHMHTTISDGRLAPAELVSLAAGAGLDYLSIADHDTLAVYQRHADLLERFGRRLITGVEVSTFAQGRELHVLGYGVPTGPHALDGVLTDRTQVRSRRAAQIVQKLQAEGVEISMDDVVRQSGGGMIGRPHIARALVDRKAARDVSDAFERYIGSTCPAFVPSSTLSPADAIAAINACGGVSVLAHPTRNAAEELLDELVDAGLRGIEVWSSSHTMHDAERLREKARARKLVMTAGTDFHGPTEANPRPGCEVEADDLRGFLDLVL
jgi:predicted metal-dependent phosphoesterase TrpH